MATPRKRIVDCASHGKPPERKSTDIETIRFTLYDFENLPHERGKPVSSPILKAHDNEWRIKVYPRGHSSSITDAEYLSCYLHSVKKESRSTKFWLHVGQKCTRSLKRTFEAGGWGYGWPDLRMRDYVIEYCLDSDGSLTIECDIQITEGNMRVWYPKKLEKQDLLVELYENSSSETSDVTFVVEETIYQVHSIILHLRAKKLYEIAKEKNSDSPIRIEVARKEIFKNILDFVYTVDTPKIKNEDVAKELLIAADFFECIHLKLYVESVMADKFVKAENAAALLIFADSHSCALLKEAAMNLFSTDADTAKRAEAWSEIRESKRLFEELFDSVTSKSREEFDNMTVTMLREELEMANLELDGSREVLVYRLQTHRQTLTGKKKQRTT